MSSYFKVRTAGLVLLMICSAFGPGFQEIPLLSFMNLVLLLTLIHTTAYNIEYPCFFVAFSIGEWIAYAKVFGSDKGSLLLTAVLAMSFVLLVGIFCGIPFHRLPRRYSFFQLQQNTSMTDTTRRVGSGAPFIFPISFTAVWSVITHIFPSGAWGTYAYMGLHQSNSNIRLLSSYFGIDGIHFWLAWASSLVFCFLVIPILELTRPSNAYVSTHAQTQLLHDERKNKGYQKTQLSSSIIEDDLRFIVTQTNTRQEEATEILPPDSLPRYGAPSSKPEHDGFQHQSAYSDFISLPQWLIPIGSFISITFILFLFPQIRSLTSYGQFYQKNIELWEHQSIRAVCLVGYGAMATIQERMEQTKNISQQALFLGPNQLDPQTAQFILWSEESWYVDTPSEEEYLFQQVGIIANSSNVTIGLGYRTNIVSPSSSYQHRNMFVLIDSKGQVVLKYQKVHPVPGIEDDIEPGDAVPPLVPIEQLGVTMGAAICFDYDFPNFIYEIGQGYSTDPLIMLQPGWDWGPIGIVHARMVAQRALENGFTLFRCSSGGVSGVYDAYGNVLIETILGTKMHGTDTENSALSFTVRIPITPRIRTMYSIVGGSLGYICLLLWFGFIVLVVVSDSWIDRFRFLAFLRSV